MVRIFVLLVSLFSFVMGCLAQRPDHRTNAWDKETSRNIGVPSKSEDYSVKKVEVGPTGDFSLAIPLMTVPGRGGLDVNVGLTYHPGVRVTQEASWVGTGWDLEIGSIKRNPVVKMDEFVDHILPPGYPTWYEASAPYDLYRDTYTITCPAGSGTIIQVQDPSDPYKYLFVLEDWRPWKIVYDTQNPSNHRFIVTTEDGTTYVFGLSLNGWTSNVFLTEGEWGSGGLETHPHEWNEQQMEWKLTAILSADYYDYSGADQYDPADGDGNYGSWVRLKYGYTTLNNIGSFKYYKPPFPSTTFVSKLDITYLRQIITPTHVAEFTTESQSVGGNDYNGNFVSYWMSSNNGASDHQVKRRLKTITLRRYKGLYTGDTPGDGPILKKIDFCYYNGSEAGGTDLSNRSFLKQVQISGGALAIPPYCFTYWNGFGSLSPSYDMTIEPSDLTHPAHIGNEGWYIKHPSGYPVQDHDSLDGNAWSLTKVVYPTGGESSFEYRSDKGSYGYLDDGDSPRWGSGTRLKSQTLSDGVNSPQVFSYQYASFDGNYYVQNIGRNQKSPIDYYNGYLMPIEAGLPYWSEQQQSKSILYGRVTEIQPNGSSITSYYATRNLGDYSVPSPGDSSDLYAKSISKRGLLSKIEFLDSVGAIVKEERFGHCEQVFLCSRVHNQIMQVSTKKVSDTTSVTEFDQNGQNGITTVSITEYHPADGLVWKHTTINGDDQRYITKYSRPGHFIPLTNTNADEYTRAIDQMRIRNMLDQVISHDELRDSSGVSYVLSSDFVLYRTDLGMRLVGCGTPGGDANCTGDGGTSPRPFESYKLRLARPVYATNVIFPYIGQPNGAKEFLYDSRYVPLKANMCVDRMGNIRETMDANGVWTTVKWGIARVDTNLLGMKQDSMTVPIATIVNSTEKESKVTLCEQFRNAGTYTQGQIAVEFFVLNNNGGVAVQRSEIGVAGASQRVHVGGGSLNGIYMVMDTMYSGRRYAVEFDYKVEEGVLGTYRNSGAGFENLVQLDTTSTWKHYRGSWNFGTDTTNRKILFGSAASSTFYLDNVRIYPSDALCTLTTYDPYSLQPIATTDENGQTKSYRYDDLQRPSKVFEGEKQTSFSYSYSRSLSSDFNSTNPNSIVTTVRNAVQPVDVNLVHDPGFEDYQGDIYWDGPMYAGTMEWSTERHVSGQWALLFTGDPYTTLGQNIGCMGGWNPPLAVSPRGEYEASVWFKAPIGVHATLFLGDWPPQSVDSSSVVGTGDWQIIALTHTLAADDTMWIWFSSHPGCLVDDFTLKMTETAPPDYGDQQVRRSASFSDGFGAEIQKSASYANGTHIIVSARTYDNMRRLDKVYEPLDLPISLHYINISAGAPHSTTAYYADPLGRPSAQGFPGTTFAIGSGHEMKFEYSSNQSTEISGFGANLFFKSRKRDEDNRLTSIFKDKIGNTALVVVDSAGLNLRTQFAYDAPGQVACTTDPRGLHTNYLYNTFGQVTQKTSPDAGTVKYYFDKNGNGRFIQDAKQSSLGRFTYHTYDMLNRPLEVGEYLIASSCTQSNADSSLFPSLADQNRIVSQIYKYDTVTYSGQNNTKGRLAMSSAFRQGSLFITTHFSYDDYGRVEWVRNQYVGGSDKVITYQYDLVGNVIEKSYLDQSNAGNNLYTFYEYDETSRLVRVYSNQINSTINRTKEAEYEYYPTGQVKRLVLGYAQGVDYRYNERDWLTQINHQNLNSTDDPGHDGSNGIPVDKFGMIIGYNNISDIGSAQSATPQYNGNVSWTMYNTSGISYGGNTPIVGCTYSYDAANRLKASNFGYYSSGWGATTAYDLPLMQYDADGNILGLQRYGQNGTPKNRFRYDYAAANRLSAVFDTVNSTSSSYSYDANGNVTNDSYRNLNGIAYDIHNLPISLNREYSSMSFWYDANGNRIRKNDSESGGQLYVLGADGQTEAVYDWNGNLRFWNILANGQIIGRIEKYEAPPDRVEE